MSSTTNSPTTPSNGFPSLQELSNSTVTLANVTRVLNETLYYSQSGENLDSTQISEIMAILEKSSSLDGIREQDSRMILQNVDNCLLANQSQLFGAVTSTTTNVLRNMVQNTYDDRIDYLKGVNLGFSAKKINCSNLTTDDGLLDLTTYFELINATTTISNQNAISVPLSDICESQKISHLYFSIYRDQKLFIGKQAYRVYDPTNNYPSIYSTSSNVGRHRRSADDDDINILPPPDRCQSQIIVANGKPVMSATILNDGETVSSVEKHDALEPPVMANLQFNIDDMPPPLHGEFKVTWWDVGRQVWSLDRPCKIRSIKNGIVSAQCQHLTDFAIIVSGSLDDRIICDSALYTTGYIVNIISIVSLMFLTVLSGLVYVNTMSTAKILFYLRGQISRKGDLVAFFYYFMLLLFYIMFVFFSDAHVVGNTTGCVIVAAMMYFFLISSIMLNLLQGIRIIYKFISGKTQIFFEALIAPPSALTIGIVFPFILTFLIAIFASDFFKRNDSFCWVRPDYLTYAIVVPITILLISALICTIFSAYKLFWSPKKKLGVTKANYHDADFWTKIVGLIVMQFTLGVPWIVQYFTLQWPTTSAWHYSFTIILGSQGTILLIVFFYRRQRLIIESRRSSAKVEMMNEDNRSVKSYLFNWLMPQSVDGRFLMLLRILAILISSRFVAAHTLNYSFSLQETDMSDFLKTYSIAVKISIEFRDDGNALFTTSVSNSSQTHFTLYANGQNCGIIIDHCRFLIGNGQTFKIQINKIDMVSNFLTFTNHGSESNLEVSLVGCRQNLAPLNCVASGQYSSDTQHNDYKDSLCFCCHAYLTCSTSAGSDHCVSSNPWWNYNTITSTTTTIKTTTKRPTSTSTTQLTTSKTTKEPTTTRKSSTSTEAASTSSTSVQTSTTTSELPATVDPNSIPTLKNLSDSGVGINNVSTVLNDTLWYSQQGADLDSTQVGEIAIILNNCANLRGLSAENSIGILKNLDNVLLVDDETMRMSGSSSDMMLGMLPTMVDNTKDEQINYLDGQNLGFTAKKIDCSKRVQDEGLLDLGNNFEIINSTVSNTRNSIVVPLKDLCATQELSHVYFTIYRKTSVFVGPQVYRPYGPKPKPLAFSEGGPSLRYSKRSDEVLTSSTTPNPNDLIPPSPCNRQVALPEAPVMTATLLNNGRRVSRATTADAPMAILRFNISDIIKPLHGNFKVTWWDIGRQKWATERNCEIISENDGILEAKCLHLTDFAIIVDALLNDPNVCDTALIDLGYAVNSFSIASLIFLTGLSITSFIESLPKTRFYDYFRGSSYIRRDFLALAYHLDLLLFYIFFTIFANQSVSGEMCTLMASIMYALLLCSLFLTMFQGLRNVISFVPQSKLPYFNMIMSLPIVIFVSIIIPFTLSVILLVFTTFFDRQDCFCWVRPDNVIVGIIVPVSLLILNAIGCTSYIVYKVFFGMRRKFSAGNHHYDPHILSKVVSILIMQVSLGLPWILQFFTLYSPYTTLWHYLFTIVMGSQGTMLLLIFLYRTYRSRQYTSSRRRTSERAKPGKFQKNLTTEETLSDSTDSDLKTY
ncbi:unnamed protein product [Caenorhabditis bovis]|uniref:G-protein coupled receptors family 2 profile 2 domain-containing protein n=1 Tax=Caenorhabditis bovis TaxID=2654633 RepID=A0A8S1FGA7_9PELO|nr:unnamed protein product [Caenorhabditis bovis]